MRGRSFRVSCLVLLLLSGPAVAQSGQAIDALAGATWSDADGAARAEFTVADPDAVIGGLFTPGKVTGDVTLNGKAIEPPLAGVTYSAIPFDAPKLLVKGVNKLAIAGAKGRPAVRLELYAPGMLDVQTGPVLGAIGADFFTVACRTNAPATVAVSAVPVAGPEISAQSQRGYYHRFRVSLPGGTKQFQYTMTLQAGGAEKKLGPHKVKIPGATGTFRFAACGDNRSHPESWSKVVAGILKARPELLVATGDLASSGKIDELWDKEFFGPARDLFATVPLYAVLGNHDAASPVFFEMIHGPDGEGRDKNWSQTLGDVLLIGIDGQNAGEFVESALKGSKAKFAFLATHYPAYSSGPHGDNDGSKNVLMPILAKYKATAMLAGHDHSYERSEPPAGKGVTCIVTGGGGAPIYGKTNRNAYSKVFAATLHFCLFEIQGDTCQMKAIDTTGAVLDEKAFRVRAIPASKPAPEPVGAPL
ncbi:MAG: metallophosphoesterase [Planctomycetota bacterium]|nr:metallophosphoesterase [Planctomycetota bacterium]